MKRPILLLSIALMSACVSSADDQAPPMSQQEQAREARMEWWREARFGMFVHWGLYSIPAGEWKGRQWKKGGVEWIQRNGDIPADVYEKELLPLFKPKADFAQEWAQTAKMAGCRYLVFTSKHHEGFALHDSKLTTFDAKDVTGRDLFQEIVDATRAEGLKVGAYHSLIDWHHPHAYTGKEFGLPFVKGTSNEGRDNSIYVDFLHGQVEEIMSNYGQIDIVWWDYSKEACQGEHWRAKELITMLRKYQPEIVMNNRLYRSPEAGWPKDHKWNQGFTMDPQYGDFSTPEQKIPATGVEGVDWETCMTMNTTWGYNQHDTKWKSDQVLIHNLVDVVSKGGNYLLNVGPMADGTIPDASLKSMAAIGRWMDVNSESIYGTQASPFSKPGWGRYTKKDGILYAHVFDWPKHGKLRVVGEHLQATRAYLLADPERNTLKLEQFEGGIVIDLPSQAPDANVSVIAIECGPLN